MPTPTPTPTPTILTDQTIQTDEIAMNVAVGGSGPALLVVHGWPHTSAVWRPMAPTLGARHTIVAPDLRGMGASERPEGGYDAATLSRDLLGVLDALGIERATVMALDLGVAPSFLLASEHPERVDALVLMEGLLGPLPGAEAFLASGLPWWFGFHAVPGLAEVVLAGHEREYVAFFLDHGRAGGRVIDPEIREAFLAAYSDAGGLRGGLEAYRALRTSGEQLLAASARRRLDVPTLAVAGGVVGAALGRQLAGVAEDLTQVTIEDCGHIVPLDRPAELEAAFTAWRARLR